MAKQVAHEIKNPLTPMKLSLQYLQRAGKLQPDLIHTLLPKLTMTIMEQINTLDEIATSFSQFASMPNPQNITFNLVDLLHQSLDMHRHHFDDNNDYTEYKKMYDADSDVVDATAQFIRPKAATPSGDTMMKEKSNVRPIEEISGGPSQ